MSVIPVTWKEMVGRSWSTVYPYKSARFYLKETESKRAGAWFKW
jgi:hypothetical protein